jgi:predicted porin
MLNNNEDANGVSTLTAEDNTSRIGVKIADNLAEGVDAFARVEVAVDADDTGSAPFNSRLAFAGVDLGTMGVLSAGRQNSVFKGAVTSKTDVFPEYGNSASQKLFSRDSHTMTYSNTFGGVKIDNLVKVDGTTGKSGMDVFESAASFDVSNSLNVGLAYSDDKVNDIQYTGTGLKYQISDVTTIGYTHTIKDVQSTNTETSANEVVASRLVDDTRYSVGYGKIEDGTAYTTVGAEKKIGDNFSLYGALQMEDPASGVDTQDMAVGMKLKF